GAGRRARVARAQEGAAFDVDARSLERAGLAGDEREAAHRSHAGERLAAEAVAVDGEEIFLRAQLAGRVPLQAQLGILARHAAAVVGDAHELAAAVEQIDGDIFRARIERVLDQLLHDGRGPLDDL